MSLLRRRSTTSTRSAWFHQQTGDGRLADRFEASLQETLNKLADAPWIGLRYATSNPRLEGLRRWFVDGFPSHPIFYLPREPVLIVIGVLHGARDLPDLLSDRR